MGPSGGPTGGIGCCGGPGMGGAIIIGGGGGGRGIGGAIIPCGGGPRIIGTLGPASRDALQKKNQKLNLLRDRLYFKMSFRFTWSL